MMGPKTGLRTFFGGPDRPPRFLRDMLEERVDQVPAGGTISWVTYYFRDEALADALLRARRRGVRVRVTMEGRPRLRHANDRVRALLTEGLGDGLRMVVHRLPLHLHEKLYCFSHPRPVALLGSFNPSGNAPEDDDVIRVIGDQDRGHNLLVEIADADLVAALSAHAAAYRGGSAMEHLWPPARPPLRADGIWLYSFPRRNSRVLIDMLGALGSRAHLRVVGSHLRDRAAVTTLCAAARAGVQVEIIAHDSQRRVPRRMERACLKAGIAFSRYLHPDRLPMHNKFILAEDGGRRWTAFGSMNLTLSSRRLNRELLAICTDRGLFDAFSERWEAIAAEPSTGGRVLDRADGVQGP
jgi:phosphatidylserine/phosphatidylglycerophosphate/cardiolipin synthase-like enzyme